MARINSNSQAAGNVKDAAPRRKRIRAQKEQIQPDPVQSSSVWDILRPLMLKNAMHDPFIEAMSQRDASGNPIWPDDFEVVNDKKRIRNNSIRFKNMSIAEAFEQDYPTEMQNVSDETKEMSDIVPSDLQIGSIVKLRILKIEKGQVIFDPGNNKTQFTTPNNLYKFEKLRQHVPDHTLNARIIDIRPDRTVVDLFGPMIDEYVLPRAQQNWIQNRVDQPLETVTVTNLHLVRGGYVGTAIIPNISEFLGEPYTVPAFVPGSQIVLNTVTDFEQFEGKTVDTFITSCDLKSRGRGISLVCSCKALIRHRGNCRMIEMHKLWCDDDQRWKDFSETVYTGRVTGVINSQKKCGAFIEIPALEITGMVSLNPDELVNYKPDDTVRVKVTGFDEEMMWNDAAGQYQHQEPYLIVNGALREISIKPVLEFAD